MYIVKIVHMRHYITIGPLQYKLFRLSKTIIRNTSTSSLATMPNEIKNIHTIDETSFPYILEQNATVELKAGKGLIRCNIYRPKSSDPVPVLVTYGPYGKDIHYGEYVLPSTPPISRPLVDNESR